MVGFKAVIARQPKVLTHKMERVPAIWCNDHMPKRMPRSLLVIQAKTCSVFKTWKARPREESMETYSKPWTFQWPRQRGHLHNWSIRGEAASVDVEAVEKFVDQVDKITEEGSHPLK